MTYFLLILSVVRLTLLFRYLKVKDVNAGPPRRTPYLYKAAIKGCLEIAEALIKAGAKVDKIKSSSGTNALMEASRQGHAEIVDLLLKSGGNFPYLPFPTNDYLLTK